MLFLSQSLFPIFTITVFMKLMSYCRFSKIHQFGGKFFLNNFGFPWTGELSSCHWWKARARSKLVENGGFPPNFGWMGGFSGPGLYKARVFRLGDSHFHLLRRLHVGQTYFSFFILCSFFSFFISYLRDRDLLGMHLK